MIEIVENSEQKADICNQILRELPSWFGIESAIVEYVENVQKMPFWAKFEGSNPIGFIAIKEHFESSAEIYVMAVSSNYHRKGVGRQLIEEAEKYLKVNKVEYFQVKTLSASHPDIGYAKTREFYLSIGFKPIEEFKTLWGDANPALMLMKKL